MQLQPNHILPPGGYSYHHDYAILFCRTCKAPGLIPKPASQARS
jgi:hypothetical protein